MTNDVTTLRRLFDVLLAEAEANPGFAKRLLAVFARTVESTSRSAPGRPRLVGGRRPPGVLDPFAVYKEGAKRLQDKLGELDVDQLKDVIAEHGMDASRLAAKWKTPERLIDLIMSTVSSRAR